MVNFTGYARQPEPKWPYILLTAVIIGVIVVVIAVSSWLGQVLNNLKVQPAKPVKTTESRPANQAPTQSANQPGREGIVIESLLFTSRVDEKNLPVDDLKEVSLASGARLYCYSKINAAVVPQKLKHVWIDPSGKIWAEINMEVSNQPANIWSYVTLIDKPAGQWEVQVQDLSGAVLARHAILIKP